MKMNKKTLIWICIGAAVAVGIYLLTKPKGSGGFLGASGVLAPEKHSFSGKVNQDRTSLFKNADGQLNQLPIRMNKGERVSVFAQADGFYKIDCDGIWIPQECVTIDPEYRNFTGDRLEPEQDLLTGKIF